MKLAKTLLMLCVVSLAGDSLFAQGNVVLGRVIGQNTLIMQSSAPNVVEGRELTNPQGVALDNTVSPPMIYVSDTGNNRVLGWKNATSFQNAAFADIIIGQKDAVSTAAFGPGTTLTKGLNSPTALAVDSQGNLYVMDAGNNRIVRYPKPFTQTSPLKLPDIVIGQADFTTRTANFGGLSGSSLSLIRNGSPLRGAMVFDSQGNLWVTDPANNRVLRFPKDPANAPKLLGTADVVLGQADFTKNGGTNTVDNLNLMNTPAGLALDSLGNIYVADAIHRVLVYPAGGASGQPASRVIGGVLSQQGGAVNPPTNKSLNSPQGVTINPGTDEVLVSDTFNTRVLKFPKLSQWPVSTPPLAAQIIGQAVETTNKAGVGPSALSAPVAVAATNTEWFVVDSLNNRVVVFPQGSGTATRVLGQLGLDENAPNLIEGKELWLLGAYPVGANTFASFFGSVVLDGNGSVPHLYVADTGNNRVLGYCDARKSKQGDKADIVLGQPDLLHSRRNGDGSTTPNTQFLYYPTGLAVDGNGSLYVADTGNGRVVRFSSPCAQPQGQQPQANLVLGQSDFVTHTTDATQATMSSPYGLALSPEGNLFVSDIFQHRVLRFDRAQGSDFSSGQNAAAVFGQQDYFSSSSGNLPNQFNSPRGLSVDSSGRLYVADFFNNRIAVYTDASHEVTPVLQVTNVTTTQALSRPHGVFANPTTGEIWVAPANQGYVFHYPAFDTLAGSPYATTQAQTATGPVSVIQDAQGDVFVAELGNRVSEYFPEVDPVNGASFQTNRSLTPGMIASVWAKRGSTPPTSASSLPLPTTLGGVQVIVAGTPAPLFYVGNSSFAGYVQINFQVPNATSVATGLADLQVIDSATQQVLGAGAVGMAAADPAFFITDTGTGQVAALITDANKNVFCNGPTSSVSTAGCPSGTRPVKRGEVITFFLTGQGYQSGWTQDGAGHGAVPTDQKPKVLIGTQFVPDQNVQYSGTAPGFVGLWQINVLVPNDHVDPDPTHLNPVAVLFRDVPSSLNGLPKTTIRIQ